MTSHTSSVTTSRASSEPYHQPEQSQEPNAEPEFIYGHMPADGDIDVWALGCSMMEVRLGNRPFYGYDLDNTSISALQNMELTMEPMPLAFRGDLKKSGFGSANCPHGASYDDEGAAGATSWFPAPLGPKTQ
ncbi:hypothetical protein B0T24DRAFT_685516 [Lasiosphaeria ovina]|uniref:Protein kinase domain-containing protein n=1 Tax=Lasiosphaeria ovina TaxID=92902 RepID=A0AAE0JT11_9PEZI|nr:hypothetical protein B0T24DRAFT_685516 [Lasiosphaeria ovina]